MESEIKCPKCNSLMEEGFLLDRGSENFLFPAWWVAGNPEKSIWMGLSIKNREVFNIKAFRCSNCSFLEFYAP
ncbi:MAG: hypothetical protein K1X72_00200 [Pyrinomonadaceae bacterium]|nr:hypothetical protein [Pyrinomonadaceae bacterium]